VRNDRLFRHFLYQFVENDLSPDADRHQVLAVAAAGLVTVPLFITVFMSVKYLMRPLQAAGWTEVTMVGDQVTFCAVSMLVAGVIATLEWDALSLSQRDIAILGVLPIPRGDIVRTKALALVSFAGASLLALNALPAILHPLLMTAALPMSPFALVPLMLAHATSTILAGALAFSSVVAIREGLYRLLGPAGFQHVTNGVRSAVLLVLLVGLALVPARVSDNAEWMFGRGKTPVALVPVSWFAATQVAIAGRVLDSLPRRDMPRGLVAVERRFTAEYRSSRDTFPPLALRGVAAVILMTLVALAAHIWNARRQSLLSDVAAPPSRRHRLRPLDAAANLLLGTGAKRAGFSFGIKTFIGSPRHRVYVIASTAVAVAVALVMSPGPSAPVRTLTVAPQALMLCFVIAGFRAAVRTAADPRAAWIFAVTDTGSLRQYRAGVRLVGVVAVGLTVVAMLPVHIEAWGPAIALAHALNGIVFGWILVEASFRDVRRPLVDSIPPPDGVNTVGVVLLGGTVFLVFVMSKIEAVTIGDPLTASLFFLGIIAIAGILHAANAQLPVPVVQYASITQD
jgi:hypothetical protein